MGGYSFSSPPVVFIRKLLRRPQLQFLGTTPLSGVISYLNSFTMFKRSDTMSCYFLQEQSPSAIEQFYRPIWSRKDWVHPW